MIVTFMLADFKRIKGVLVSFFNYVLNAVNV